MKCCGWFQVLVLVPLPAQTFPCSASLMGTVVVGDHERGYPALLFLTRGSRKISAVKSRDEDGTLHDTFPLVVSRDGEAQRGCRGSGGPARVENFASITSFPVLLLLRQLNVAQLVNKPGGQSSGESWHSPRVHVHGRACACVHARVCAPFVNDAAACWDLADVCERSDSPLPPSLPGCRQHDGKRTEGKRTRTKSHEEPQRSFESRAEGRSQPAAPGGDVRGAGWGDVISGCVGSASDAGEVLTKRDLASSSSSVLLPSLLQRCFCWGVTSAGIRRDSDFCLISVLFEACSQPVLLLLCCLSFPPQR